MNPHDHISVAGVTRSPSGQGDQVPWFSRVNRPTRFLSHLQHETCIAMAVNCAYLPVHRAVGISCTVVDVRGVRGNGRSTAPFSRLNSLTRFLSHLQHEMCNYLSRTVGQEATVISCLSRTNGAFAFLIHFSFPYVSRGKRLRGKEEAGFCSTPCIESG